MAEKVSRQRLSGAVVWRDDRRHVYEAWVIDRFSSYPRFSVACFLPLLFSRLLFPPCSLTGVSPAPFLPLLSGFVVERREIHDDTAGWDAAWHRCGDEVPVRHELCSQRPRCPKYPGQQQLSLQGLWLWPVTLSGWHLRRPHLHELPGQYYACLLSSDLCLYTLCMSNRAC